MKENYLKCNKEKEYRQVIYYMNYKTADGTEVQMLVQTKSTCLGFTRRIKKACVFLHEY